MQDTQYSRMKSQTKKKLTKWPRHHMLLDLVPLKKNKIVLQLEFKRLRKIIFCFQVTYYYTHPKTKNQPKLSSSQNLHNCYDIEQKKKGHETSHPFSYCIPYKNCLDIESQFIAKVCLKMALRGSQRLSVSLRPISSC